jgi:hypothetical protein
MSRRGTTIVAWVIGLSALAAQGVIVPLATAMLRDRETTPVEIIVPALPAAEKQPTTDVDKGNEGPRVMKVIAFIG